MAEEEGVGKARGGGGLEMDLRRPPHLAVLAGASALPAPALHAAHWITEHR